MPFRVTEFETTPNPNAVKCWLDRPISDSPRSFLNADMAAADPVAQALFAEADVTTVLFNGDFVTVNKAPDAEWKKVKASVKKVLAAAADGMTAGAEDAGASGMSLPAIARALEEWFVRHARDLPWRRDRSADGYRELVAETMLQQTQVARVIEHYPEFLRRLPTAQALADADEQDVLAAWQGLGYYRRAKHLHAAAKMIVDDFNGRVPETVAELRRLPGVGRYTAGAVASIVHGRAEPIVDGNVQRVLARIHANSDPPTDRATVNWCWAQAETLVREARRPGDLNEALMELGATVCTPRGPACDRCPLADHCQARKRGLQHDIPPPKPAAKQEQVHHHAVIVRRGAHVLLEKRPASGLWADMWQTPTVEADSELKPAEIAAALPQAVDGLEPLDAFDYQTTHRKIRFHVFQASSRAHSGEWRRPHETADLPMSNAHRRILALAQT